MAKSSSDPTAPMEPVTSMWNWDMKWKYSNLKIKIDPYDDYSITLRTHFLFSQPTSLIWHLLILIFASWRVKFSNSAYPRKVCLSCCQFHHILCFYSVSSSLAWEYGLLFSIDLHLQMMIFSLIILHWDPTTIWSVCHHLLRYPSPQSYTQRFSSKLSCPQEP